MATFRVQWGEWAPKGTFALGWLDNDEVYGSMSRERPSGFRGREVLKRVGKKAAGRVLDERTWDEFPKAVRGRASA
jgi:hypothetical protein